MNRTLLLMAVAAVATSGVKAQSVTYNHDSPKQNQITVMETGTGALSPELYYTLLHNKYKKSAASKNKLSFRTLAGVNLYNQTDEAEAIDSALVKRAEIEALNVADRQIDLAWLAEGDKINAQMERFQRNIDRILLAGGTTDDKERWTEYYHVYQCAIDATKDAYMPNAQRKKEYLRIYEDVVRQNEILVGYLARRQNATATDGLLNVTADRTLDKSSVVRNAMSRWNESRLAVRGSQSDGGIGTGDGDETVNRRKYSFGFRYRPLGRGDRRRDFSDQRVPDRRDLYRLARSILVDIADVHGAGRPVRYRHGGRHGVQNDGQARAFGRDEALQTAGRVAHSLLVVSSGRHGHGKQREQLVLFRFPLLYPELRRFVHT